VIEYIKEGLTEEAIKEILLKTNLQPQELVRTQEDYFKKQLKGLSFNTEEWIRVISENPTLLRRPIIVG
jgi:arsenate reductase